MVNNKRKFTLEIEALFKGDKAKENAKSLGKDITSILENIGKSGDAMDYFRELVQYIGLIDSELSAFRAAHSDDFDKIFSGLDSNLQQQLEGIFQTTKANLTTIDQLRRRITDTETKIPKEGVKSLDKSEQGVIADEAKKIKSDIESLYADLGKPITISNRLGPQKMLAEAKTYLNDFAREWDGVNERVARGLGIGVGGTGTGSAGGSNPITDELDEMSQNIKNSIRELEDQIEKLKEQKEGLTKILNDSQNIKSDDVDLSVDSVRKLVDEYETLSNSIKNVDHSSDEYYNSLARIVEVSSKMNAALKKLKQSDDSVKEIFRNTVLFEGEGVRKTLFGQLAAGGGDQVYKDWRTRAKNKRDTYNIAIDEKTTQIRDLKVTEAQIEQNKKLGLSYKSLAKYAVDYMNISSKVGRGDTLTNDDEKLMSQMAKDLKAFAKAKKIAMQDLDDIFAKAETGGFADEDAMLKELCKTLGVQIPKNAQKAKDAVKELDNVADTISVSSDSSDNSGLRTGSSSDNGVSDTVLSNLESTIKQEISSIRDKMGELDISEIINGIKQEIGLLSDKLDFSNLEEVIRGELSSTNTNIDEAASRIVAAILGDSGTVPGGTNGAGGTINSSRNNRGMSDVEQNVMQTSIKSILDTSTQKSKNFLQGKGNAKETMHLFNKSGVISSVQGNNYVVDGSTLVNQMLSNLKHDVIMSLHDHPNAIDAFTPDDIATYAKQYYGQGTKLHGIIANSIIKTIDFNGISQETAIKISQSYFDNLAQAADEYSNIFSFDKGEIIPTDAVNMLQDTDPFKYTATMDALMDLANASLYDAFEKNGVEPTIKQFTKSQIPELVQYIGDIQSKSQNALGPVEKLQNLISSLVPDKTIDWNKYSNELNQFVNGKLNERDVFDKIYGDVKSSGAPKEATYQDKLNTVNQITKAYDNYYAAKDKFDNADDGKAAERAEESFERAKENLELYQDKYHSVMATMEDGSKMHIPLDDSFDQEIRNILDDADKIKDIDLVPKSAGAAVEGYEAIDRAIEKISTRTKDIDNLDQKVGYFKDSAIQKHLSYLQKAKSDIESQDSNFIYGSKDKYNQATSLISKLETLSSRQSLYNDFKDNIVNTDKFREFNATGEHVRTVLDGIKDGTFTTVEQCVARLKELGGAIENVGDSSQVQPAEEVVSKIASTEGESNATSEVASLEMLDAKLKEVTAAVEAKTQAFRDEGAVVDEVIASEKQALEGLDNKLAEISTQAKLVGDSFQQVQQLSNVTTKDNKQTDAAQDGKTTTSEIVNDQTYNVSSEIEQLSILEQKVNEVKAAVESKTQAFKEEGTVVDTVITKELEALEVLSTYLDVIRLTINEVADSLNLIKSTNLNELQNDSVNDTENTTTSNTQDLNNKYALDSTLSTTNSILQSILAAVSGGESTNQVVKALEGAIADLKVAADTLKTNANDIKQKTKDSTKEILTRSEKTKETSSEPKKIKETSTSSTQTKQTFDELKNAEVSNFEKYKQDVESSIYATDEFKDRVSKLGAELNNIGDAKGLDAWKQNIAAFQDEFSRYEDTNKKILTGEINSITKEAANAMKSIKTTIDPEKDSEGYKRQLAAQEAIQQGFKEIQIASDACTNQIKNNQFSEIDAFKKAKAELLLKKQELLQSVHAYEKEYDLLNSGGKSGKKYGATDIMRETTRYNQFQQYAGDANMGFKDSGVFNAKLQEYISAYNRLIAVREKLASKTVLTDRDVQEFNDAKQAAVNYGKELDKMIAKSKKLMSNSYNKGKIGSDIDVEDALSRKKALTDFVTGMHDASESTIKFSNDYQECTFKMKNSEGTFTKMTATLDKTTHKMYSVAGEVTKYKTAFGEFIGSLKGEFLKLGRYMVASFGIQEVIQAVRMGVGYVKEIDNALTDLKKVTNETDAGYERFLQTMSKTAGVVGSTVAELTTMAAEWARLGWILNQPHYIVIYK